MKQQIRNFLQQRWVIALAILCAVLLIISAMLRVLTPPQEPIPKNVDLSVNYDGSITIFKKVEFTGSPITIPEKFDIAIAKPTSLDTTIIQRSLIQNYKLKPHLDLEDFWQSEDYSLIRDLDTNAHTFSYIGQAPSEKIGIDEARAITAAEEFVQKNFPALPLKVQRTTLQYWSSGVEATEVSKESAARVVIPFAQTVSEFPFMYGNKAEFPFLMTVNAQNQIEKAFFYPHFMDLQVIEQRRALSIDQGIKNIQNGEASILLARQQEWGRIDMNTIETATFTTVSIEYRLDAGTGLITPFFHFKGKLVNALNVELDADVITPAVETETR